MRRISHEQRVLIIHCLVEGMSMRGTSRVARVSINTTASVLREIGVLADQYHHDNVVGVRAKRVQLDEIWGFIAAKAKTAKAKGRKDAGDVWTWIALDPDTKLVISYLCGSRSGQAAFGFMLDLKGRLVGPIPHFTSDGFVSYEAAIYKVFGAKAPYTQLVFDEENRDLGRTGHRRGRHVLRGAVQLDVAAVERSLPPEDTGSLQGAGAARELPLVINAPLQLGGAALFAQDDAGRRSWPREAPVADSLDRGACGAVPRVGEGRGGPGEGSARFDPLDWITRAN